MGTDPNTGNPDPCPMEPGSKGTVRNVVKLWDFGHQITVDWDPEVGRSLALISPTDTFKIIERAET
jgi:hypothetical protein